MERLAAIDVGTISVRLLVAETRSGRPEQIVRRAVVTRLGEGLRPGGCLLETAAARTRAAALAFIQEAVSLGAGRIFLVGTSAARDAADGAAFVRSLAEDHRVAAWVLTGAEEAAYAYAGASLDIPGEIVVLDVGGGSTELIGSLPRGGVEAVSLELGASRATERWVHSDPPGPEEVLGAYEEAQTLIGSLRGRYGADQGAAASRLVGVAGTVTTLACLDAGLQAYISDAIHLRTLSLASVEHLIARLAAMTVSERAALPCVQAGRAPVIVAGAVIVRAAMRTLGYAVLTVSERDLLDGLVLAAPC